MTLEELRVHINTLDDTLLELLNKRMEYVEAVGKVKQNDGSSIYRPEREQQIIQRLCEKNDGHLTPDAIEAIYMEIFAVSRNLELPEKVAYLGPEGSYSHQTAEARFGAMSSYLPLNSIEAVFKVLENKEAKFGVVPIENNTDGAVGATLDCLGKYNSLIVAEAYMDIHHSFATVVEELKDIKRIYSHPQGYNQCKNFLEEHLLQDVEFIPTRSTSAAARRAKDDTSSAAICSHIAAKLNKLPIHFEKIEDNLANQTRFLILSDFKNQKGDSDKTSILAKTEDKPGSLVAFLQSFQDKGINLTKIESRPLKEKNFQSIFFIDFKGHIDDEKIKALIENSPNKIKWLGSYVNGEKDAI
ncbi:MAG: prephenate dehydratase [Epsilonproteobacteria bacterium]|nr:prephenate dehydratase [Campylobacterota bacterium]